MSGARTRLVTAVVTVAAVAGLALAGCSDDSGGADADTDLSLPSSLSAPTTAPGASPSTPTSTPVASTTTTARVPATNPTPAGAPVMSELTVVPGPCVAGSTTAVISYRVEPDPPVRIVAAFLDRAEAVAGTSTTAGPITLPPVPCDGAIHQVQVIATGTGAPARSSALATTFTAPRS